MIDATVRAGVLATLVRVLGDIDLAEDALQDALVRAVETWPRDGTPDSPRAWLLTVARRSAIDHIRRESQRASKEASSSRPAPSDSYDLLSLIFTCCHPALSPDSQVALALRTLGGLTTAEVARALLVPEPTMAKRLVRAKQKIRQAGIPFAVPPASALAGRLDGVAATIYLIYNEGYAASTGPSAVRSPLTGEAIWLARLLVSLVPGFAAPVGLLALMLLQESRKSARVSPAGELVLLADQDRSLWDASLIRQGVTLVGRALALSPDHPSPYPVQAAIAACHALAPSYDETNWDAIISWYDVLLTVQDTPVVRLNRAAAIASRDGPAVALPLVDALSSSLVAYPWFHATRGELLTRLSRPAEAADAYRAALALPLNETHQAYLRSRLDAL